mmetsp:Transcript_12091/g.22623  ORF Transcript_12091/g.22623 Transcript_12091/m.22623 type:complete len:643 (-) Transcript_12091:59-1987(-)
MQRISSSLSSSSSWTLQVSVTLSYLLLILLLLQLLPIATLAFSVGIQTTVDNVLVTDSTSRSIRSICSSSSGTNVMRRGASSIPTYSKVPTSRTTIQSSSRLFDSSSASSTTDLSMNSSTNYNHNHNSNNNNTRDLEKGEERKDVSNGKHHVLSLQDDDAKKRAYRQQTPHSGRHFLPSHPAYHFNSSTRSNETKKGTLRQRISKFKQQSKNLILSKLPISRRHAYRNKHKRFMEGWYYRITLPEENVSFAFIFSIEDPNYKKTKKSHGNLLSLAAVQVMGPNDEYVVQADKDHSKFWASDTQQAFGCTFESSSASSSSASSSSSSSSLHPVIDPEHFHTTVHTGFQMLPTRLQGKVNGHDGSLGGVLKGQGIPRTCEFDMTIRPLSGWGNDQDDNQKSTAGWLASFSVFEPHWQITLADARATGYATWNGKRYDFKNVPFYAEKNWGGAFPSKWYWVQCNSFEGFTCPEGSCRLSLTAGGGIRKIPFGKTEELGMVCVHLNGVFYEAVPWTGEMEWNVDPWGSWSFSAKCTSGERLFEVEVMAKCEEEGVVLRAPTPDLGLAYFCRDSFYANVELSLYEIDWDKDQRKYVRGNAILDKVKSIARTGAVEIGGGPYWNPWKGKSKMKEPLKTLVKLPYMLQK